MAATKATRRQTQKEDTRRLILRTAYALFAEKGYERTTMRLLADRAGVALGTIFTHFPDKPSLLVAAFGEDVDAVVRAALETLPAQGLVAQLVHLTRHLYTFYAANPNFSRSLLKESLFLDGAHGATLDAQLDRFLEAVAGLAAQAVQRGEIQTDPRAGAIAYGAVYFSCLVMALKQPAFDVPSQTALVEALLATYFQPTGLRGPTGA